MPLRLKVEINTIDGEAVLPLKTVTFAVANTWYKGAAEIATYQLEELLGTKLRALYQRKKGRDLFDLQKAIKAFPNLDLKQIVHCLDHYLKIHGHHISRAQFESNLAEKLSSRRFQEDLISLLTEEETFNFEKAAREVETSLISLLAGKPWKGKTP